MRGVHHYHGCVIMSFFDSRVDEVENCGPESKEEEDVERYITTPHESNPDGYIMPEDLDMS